MFTQKLTQLEALRETLWLDLWWSIESFELKVAVVVEIGWIYREFERFFFI